MSIEAGQNRRADEASEYVELIGHSKLEAREKSSPPEKSVVWMGRDADE